MSYLSALQVRAARMLAARVSQLRVAEILGVHKQTISNWTQLPQFKELVGMHAERHGELVSAMLREGELEAAATLREALAATNKEGDPLWKVRIQAATRLADGRGERGKPTDRLEAKTLGLSGDLSTALSAALRDPSVKKWLETQPHIMAALPPSQEIIQEVEDARPEGS